MKVISPMLKRVLYPCLSSAGWFDAQLEPSGFTAITYHGVFPEGYKVIDPDLDGGLIDAKTFRRQLRILKQRYNVISPQQLRVSLQDGKPLPSGSVLLTCDDGLVNHATEMLPTLQEEGLACLFFVTAASVQEDAQLMWYDELYLMMMEVPMQQFAKAIREVVGLEVRTKAGRRSLWAQVLKVLSGRTLGDLRQIVRQLRGRVGLSDEWRAAYLNDPVLRRRFQLLNREEVKALASAGMTIGSHTISHPMLSHISAERAREEMGESRRMLEEALGRPVWALAYPYGEGTSVDTREFRLAEEAGYCCAFMNVDSRHGEDVQRFAMPRVHVTRNMSMAEFEAHICGYHARLRLRFAQLRAATASGGAH
ncbi:MAG TPA: polysaccharide deacetylase family protein [Terriglobales bacterium]|nr:polysaccharide deacetylase family protein [Terriglobales bacterium]